MLGKFLDGREELASLLFYITLELQIIHLHNFLYHYGSSHDIMSLVIYQGKIGTRIHKSLQIPLFFWFQEGLMSRDD